MKSGETARQGNGLPCVPNRTASEARRPEAGSRAGGVSRAERGNDGSPSGARRRRRLDALRARQRDRPSPRWPGTPGLQRWMSKMPRTDAMSQASGSWLYCFLRQWLCGRAGAAGSAISRGAKLRAAGIARRAFPWRQAKRAAPRQGREGIKPSRQGAGWIPKPASTAKTNSADSAHRARTAPKARQAGRTR